MDSLANEELCFELVRDLASKWSGTLWRNESPTPEEQETIDSLVDRKALYRRVGYDERWIKFGKNRDIVEGAAECERLWVRGATLPVAVGRHSGCPRTKRRHKRRMAAEVF